MLTAVISAWAAENGPGSMLPTISENMGCEIPGKQPGQQRMARALYVPQSLDRPLQSRLLAQSLEAKGLIDHGKHRAWAVLCCPGSGRHSSRCSAPSGPPLPTPCLECSSRAKLHSEASM